MLEFRYKLEKQSKSLMVRFSSVGSPLPTKLFKMKRSWTDYIEDYSNISVVCDLTLKQYISYSCPLTHTLKYEKISEGLAHYNCINFANRLNTKVYKNAYKRYGKKLDMVSVVEGGKKDLREYARDDKNIHAHIAVEKPEHLSFGEFKNIIQDCWTNTTWGKYITKITLLKSKTGYANYQIKDSLDSLVLPATNIKQSWEREITI